MSLPQREHPEAAAELDAAVDWYDEQGTGLAVQLIDQAEAARRGIANWPDAWPPFPGWDREPPVRSKKIDGYPYRVVYFVYDEEVVIVAYAHERRQPGYWADRVGR